MCEVILKRLPREGGREGGRESESMLEEPPRGIEITLKQTQLSLTDNDDTYM